MKNILLIVILLVANISGQWKYYSGANKIDGDYRTSMIIGDGPIPYGTPEFVVSLFNEHTIKINISGIGYLGCGGRKVKFVFDDAHHFYEADVMSIDKNNKILFMESFYRLSTSEFIQKLTNHSKMSVFVSDDCGKGEWKFSLSGSSKAIDFVLSEYKNILE